MQGSTGTSKLQSRDPRGRLSLVPLIDPELDELYADHEQPHDDSLSPHSRPNASTVK